MALDAPGGVLVDFSRFTALRERHRVRRDRLAAVTPSPARAAAAVEPSLVARPDIEEAPRPGPARHHAPWGADGLRPPSPPR